jgi:hypothetical protein
MLIASNISTISLWNYFSDNIVKSDSVYYFSAPYGTICCWLGYIVSARGGVKNKAEFDVGVLWDVNGEV